VARWKFQTWSPEVAFVAALVISIVMALHAPGVVQGDEKGFLYYGTMQAEMFVGCVGGDDQACVDWRWAEPYEGYGSHNPKLGLYMLGVVDHATRGLPVQHRVPAMRLVWALMGALCVGGLALLARNDRARAGGIMAGVLLLGHPVFRACQVALLPDLPMLLFVLAALLCAQKGLAARRVGQGLWLMDAGALAGLAVATKLYALALLPVLLLMVIVGWRKVGWRGWLGLMLGLAVGLLVFVGTNPYLWHHPQEALRAMTAGHVLAQHGTLTGIGTGMDSLRFLAWLPFSMPLVPPLNSRSEIMGLGPIWITWFGVMISAIGLVMHILRRRWLPVVFLVSTFALTAWVITRFEPSWLYPRAFLLPSVAAVWLASCVLDGLGPPAGGR